jgi:chromosome segregation ATPase
MNHAITTAFVVLLTDLLLHGDWINEGTTLEVDKSLRNDWKGSGLCRDATEAEIETYRGEQGEADDLLDDVDGLAGQKRALELELEKLQGRKTELAGDLQALESDVADLGKQKEALGAEVKKLEAAKAAAEKPATAAKPK